MFTAPRHLQRFSGFVIGLLCLVMLGLIPTLPSRAAVSGQIQNVDDLQGQFADGTFQRTAIGTYESETITDDKPGVVQLAPIGILSRWDVSTPSLPLPLANTGLVGLGNYLFAVTGETDSGKSDIAYRALINRVNGRPQPYNQLGDVWEDFTIPAAEASLVPDCIGNTAAARVRAGVAATESSSSGTLGYIYIVGGVLDLACASDMTTPLVQIGVVSSSGEITSWVKAPNLPSPDPLSDTAIAATPLGIADAMVTIVRTSTNKRFLYVIGGYSTDATDPFTTDRIYKATFYARIDPTTGALRHPVTDSTTDVWVRDANINMENDAKPGLRDGTAMAASATRVDNSTNPPSVVVSDAIFVAGGCYETGICDDNNDFVYRASVNPDTGALTWSDRPNVGGTAPVGVSGRSGLGGVAFGNKLYLVGGSTTGEPDAALLTVPTAFYNDSLEIEQLGSGQDFFVGLTESVLPESRTNVGVATLPALPPEDETDRTLTAAWIYVAGGSNRVSGRDTRHDSLYIGRLGGEDEVTVATRVRDGWYYSAPIDITISGQLALVLSVRWTAEINRDPGKNTQADIHVEFRKTVTASGLCRVEDFQDATSDRWRPMDGDLETSFRSKDNTDTEPDNVVLMSTLFGAESVDATCFQYRARFLQNGTDTGSASPDPSGTPRLLRFSIEKALAAAPDLKLKELQVTTRDGRVVGSLIQIRNLNTRGVEFTLPANADGGGDGDFLVILCVQRTAPGGTVIPMVMPPPPSTPPNLPSCAVAYTLVEKSRMQVGSLLTINQWREPGTNDLIRDIRELFSVAGTYQVGVVIDYWDYVAEGSDGELNNRGEDDTAVTGKVISFTVTDAPFFILNMPIINR